MSEETIVRQAAPTLAGIKTGSMFPYRFESREELLKDIRAFNRIFVPRGMCLLLLRLMEKSALLYLYRPQSLEKDLEDSEFEPMFDGVKKTLGGKRVGLFGSYGWGDGEWMRNWEDDCRACGINLAAESVLVNNAPEGEGAEACKALGTVQSVCRLEDASSASLSSGFSALQTAY